MNYYFLVAQLPSLAYGQPAPMSSGAFRDLCRASLSPEDLAPLDCVGPGFAGGGEEGASCAFLDAWQEWERAVKCNLARYRSQKLKREGAQAVEAPDYPVDAVAAAKAAVSMDSPLEGELFLDKARWDAIGGFQGLEYFGVNAVYAYLLKLELMERRAQFNVEDGFAEYKGLYASIVEALPGN